MIKDNAVLYCLEDSASYLGISILDFKRLLQQGKIRYCKNLSTPVSDAFVSRSSVENRMHDHYFKVMTDNSVQDGNSLPDVPRMTISSSDVIQTDYLGYLSYQTVHDWEHQIENSCSNKDAYEARVFESFSGITFSVYEIDRDGENEWSIQPDEPLPFPLSLGKDGLLSEAQFSVEELERVKAHISVPKDPKSASSESSAKDQSSTAKKRWKTPAEFFTDEDNFTWRPEEGRKAWWQVKIQKPETKDKQVFFRALLLYFLFRPDGDDPSFAALIEFMQAYEPDTNDKSPLWSVIVSKDGGISLDGTDNYRPKGNLERTMKGILKTRKAKN